MTGSWFRTGRFTEVKGRWYFHTREATTEGPFPAMLEAQVQLERYIKLQLSGLKPAEDKYSMTIF